MNSFGIVFLDVYLVIIINTFACIFLLLFFILIDFIPSSVCAFLALNCANKYYWILGITCAALLRGHMLSSSDCTSFVVRHCFQSFILCRPADHSRMRRRIYTRWRCPHPDVYTRNRRAGVESMVACSAPPSCVKVKIYRGPGRSRVVALVALAVLT